MKIIKATDYGYRKVIVVVLNSDEPEAVHGDGTAHTGAPPMGTDLSLKPWEWCHDCRYNWQLREFLWTGDELYTRRKDGTRRVKTDAELVSEIKTALQPPTPATTLAALVGRDL